MDMTSTPNTGESKKDLHRTSSKPHYDRSISNGERRTTSGSSLEREEEDVIAIMELGLEQAGEPTHKSEVPDGGYGWVVVACMVAMNASTWGMNTTYGVFTSYYMQNNYFSGGSPFRYAWVGGLSVATALASGPLGNYLCRVFGMRVPMVLGMLCASLGQCLAGICTRYATFLVCQGFVFGLGLGLMLIATSPLLAHWFDRRLSLAQGIANGGSGLGGLIFSNTTRLALERLGVKWALVINGLITFVMLVPVVIFIKGRHQALQTRSLSLEFSWFVHPGYVWVLLWGCCSMMAYFVSLYSLASFATSGLGLTQTKGASLQSILSAAQMIGRPTIGFLLDRGGRINMTSIAYLIVGLSCLAIWLPAKSYGVLILFAIVQGATSGTVWSAGGPISAQMVGVKDLASALSVFWISMAIPAMVAQPLAILLLNYSKEDLGREGPEAYYNSIGFAAALGTAAGLMLIGAKRYYQGNWKILAKS